MAKKVAKRVEVRPERCVGCRSCELACAVAHSKAGELIAALQEMPRPRTRVHVTGAGGFCVPMACRHCSDAPCVTVCPTKAMTRSEPTAPVVLDDELCIGCRACAMVCPFGVISVGEGGHAVLKCDLCGERVGRGENPACVEACPTKALRFVDVEEASAERRRSAAGEIAAGVKAGAGQKG